jgi:hypothetical protein
LGKNLGFLIELFCVILSDSLLIANLVKNVYIKNKVTELYLNLIICTDGSGHDFPLLLRRLRQERRSEKALLYEHRPDGKQCFIVGE